jgi:1-acyl-sn-glycerol-3-phosphate acyltransferase
MTRPPAARSVKRTSHVDPPLRADTTMPFGSRVLGAARLGTFAALTLVAVPMQIVVLRILPRAWSRLPRLYHRLTASLMGFDVVALGEMSTRRPTLFVSNHASYLDITVLGTLLDASFVAKADVAGWPVFGLLAKLQRTVFVDRRRGTAHRQRDDLRARLEAGDSLVLFPEGTSSDGNRVLPFRSALMSVAEGRISDRSIEVQPVSVSYTMVNGLPLGRDLRPLVAWYGAMELAPHLWQFASLGRVRAVIEFHPPIRIDDFASRKELARHCAEEVAAGLSRALTGRHRDSTGKDKKDLSVNSLASPERAGRNDYTGRPAA